MKIIFQVIVALVISSCIFATMRFTDNQDGTITDNGTGLVWQKCSEGQSATDCSGLAVTVNWQSALQYCRALDLANRAWRLPNGNELKSIVDYAYVTPSINSTFFPNTSASYYWTSTTVDNDATSSWWVRFNAGDSGKYAKTTGLCVRCVADGP
jgi:hypothetical protein